MSTEHPFVMCNTHKGLRIIKLVESLEGIENTEYRWTREQLEKDYVFVSTHNPHMQQQFPYYELKS